MSSLTQATIAGHVRDMATFDSPMAALAYVEAVERNAETLHDVAVAASRNAHEAAADAERARLLAVAARTAYTTGGAS